MVTIKDVARIAGVSSSTVSRIVNNSKPVSHRVRQRVLKAIDDTGYKPNTVARSMVLKKSQVIGVLITDISNRYYAEFVRGIENAAYKNNYSIMLCDSNFSESAEKAYLELMKDKMVDGIIVSTRHLGNHFLEFSEKFNTPIVYENRTGENIYSVSVDNELMGYRAVEHLIQTGHRHIGCIHTELDDVSVGLSRFRGYKRAIEKYGLTLTSSYYEFGDFTIKSGYQAMNRLLEGGAPLSAVFVSTDEMAIGAYAAISDRGLTIPGDISVVGFDDIDMAQYLRPQLTTIHQPIHRIGMKSVDLLVRLINRDFPKSRTLLVDTELRIRDSVVSLV